MKQVTYEYGLSDKVTIRAVDMPGRVDSLSTSEGGHTYRVVYWNDGKRYSEWMYGWEIEKRPQRKRRQSHEGHRTESG